MLGCLPLKCKSMNMTNNAHHPRKRETVICTMKKCHIQASSISIIVIRYHRHILFQVSNTMLDTLSLAHVKEFDTPRHIVGSTYYPDPHIATSVIYRLLLSRFLFLVLTSISRDPRFTAFILVSPQLTKPCILMSISTVL